MATPDSGSASRRSWMHRLGWLVLLWIAGVAALGAVALLLRALMHGIGLTR